MGIALSILTFLIGGFLVYGVQYFISDASSAWLTIGAILMGVGALSLLIVLTYRASKTLATRGNRRLSDDEDLSGTDTSAGLPGRWPAETLR